jgi:hypothetical protein
VSGLFCIKEAEMKYALLFAAAVLFLGGSLACAESITIENPSFEDPYQVKTQPGLPTGWSLDGNAGGCGLEVGAFDGNVCMFVDASSSGNSTVFQLTDHTITAGDEYTLTFNAKFTWNSGFWPGSYEGGLYYDDAGTREMLGTAGNSFASGGYGEGESYSWIEYTVVVPIGLGSPAIGKKLGFSYTNTTVVSADWGAWAGCDVVSIENLNNRIARGPRPADGAPVVEPATDFDWMAPPAYTPEKYVMYLRANEPNFIVPGNILDGEEVSPVYDHPDDLEFNTPYYWRIDSYEPNELGPGLIKNTGTIWSFTTAPETPTITEQSVSQTVDPGSEVVLAVDGTKIDYCKWYKDGELVKDGSPPSEDNAMTLTIDSAQVGGMMPGPTRVMSSG